MITQGSIIYDKMKKCYGAVDSIESKPQGLLYRVKFKGKWGSYYGTKFHERFKLISAGVNTKENTSKKPNTSKKTYKETSNLICVDFKHKRRVKFDSWLKSVKAV